MKRYNNSSEERQVVKQCSNQMVERRKRFTDLLSSYHNSVINADEKQTLSDGFDYINLRWDQWQARPQTFVPLRIVLHCLCEYFQFYHLQKLFLLLGNKEKMDYWLSIWDYIKPNGYLEQLDQLHDLVKNLQERMDLYLEKNLDGESAWSFFDLFNSNQRKNGLIVQLDFDSDEYDDEETEKIIEQIFDDLENLVQINQPFQNDTKYFYDRETGLYNMVVSYDQYNEYNC